MVPLSMLFRVPPIWAGVSPAALALMGFTVTLTTEAAFSRSEWTLVSSGRLLKFSASWSLTAFRSS